MTALAVMADALGGVPLVVLPAALAWGLASIWLSPAIWLVCPWWSAGWRQRRWMPARPAPRRPLG